MGDDPAPVEVNSDDNNNNNYIYDDDDDDDSREAIRNLFTGKNGKKNGDNKQNRSLAAAGSKGCSSILLDGEDLSDDDVDDDDDDDHGGGSDEKLSRLLSHCRRTKIGDQRRRRRRRRKRHDDSNDNHHHADGGCGNSSSSMSESDDDDDRRKRRVSSSMVDDPNALKIQVDVEDVAIVVDGVETRTTETGNIEDNNKEEKKHDAETTNDIGAGTKKDGDNEEGIDKKKKKSVEDAMIELLSSDDDDDDDKNNNNNGRMTRINVLRRHGASKQSLEQVAKARKAIEMMTREKNGGSSAQQDPLARKKRVTRASSRLVAKAASAADDDDDDVVDVTADQSAKSLSFNVKAIIEGGSGSTARVEEKNTVIHCNSDETIKTIMERYKGEMGFITAASTSSSDNASNGIKKKTKATVSMTYDGKALDRYRMWTPTTLDMKDGATIDAKIFVIEDASNMKTKKPGSANAAANVGPTIEVYLRCANANTTRIGGGGGNNNNNSNINETIKIGMREELKSLVEKYRMVKKLPASTTIDLKFDGETLCLVRTPASYDMENEDLIDVVYST